MPRRSAPNLANNRTDLLTPTAPTRQMTAPNQPYGQRAAQAAAERAVPTGPPPAATPPGPSAPTPEPGAPAPRFGPARQPEPGDLPWLEHPGSGGPPTTGLPNSAGPGPEVLTGLGAQWHAQQSTEQGTLQTLLAHLASQPMASSVIKTLAASAGK